MKLAITFYLPGYTELFILYFRSEYDLKAWRKANKSIKIESKRWEAVA